MFRPWHLLASALLSIFLLPTISAHAADAPAPPPFELKDGDRVVFVGGTFMERESQFGYIETMLTTRFPDRNVTFRNLGYAGDTVGVEARRICSGWAVFGGPDDGFNRLTKLVQEIKPTVVFAAYGMGESFEGEAKLLEFVAKYNRLLDMLTSNSGIPAEQVRVVLIGPNFDENAGATAEAHNKQIEVYTAAIQEIAGKRGARSIDLYRATHRPTKNPEVTDNGIHLTAAGYWFIARNISAALGLGWGEPSKWKLDLGPNWEVKGLTGPQVIRTAKTDKGVQLEVLQKPLVKKPEQMYGGDEPSLAITGLDRNRYIVRVGDKIMNETAGTVWADGMGLPIPAAVTERGEQLRQLIVAKNFDYFNYFRPQNDTYILGYRKREQGRNAVEIPQFKPLVEAKEKEIARLRVPQPVTYTLEKQ